MREILFRGKRKDNGKWIYGNLLDLDKDSGYLFIVEPYLSASTLPLSTLMRLQSKYVIEETVGQYTGLTDKNGTKIFEGDIVKGTFLGFPMPLKDDVFSISWQKDVAGYKSNYFENIEVIGNIHDNPELLKGAKEMAGDENA